MTYAVHTGTLSGVEALPVVVEVSALRGLPGFDIVGLPEAAVRESRVRVAAALANAGFTLPERRFVVNMAPADVRKSGSSFDLAIAVALLTACGLCAPNELEHTLIVGELALDGKLRSVRGILAQLRSAKRRGLRAALIPEEDGVWSSLVEGIELQCATTLEDAVAFLQSERRLPTPALDTLGEVKDGGRDLSDVRGQQSAKRALEVAAAGFHNVLMIGPPGTGKTMLASRLKDLLPPPTREERLDIATVASAGGLRVRNGHLAAGARPFRAPHHSCTDVALIGGGDPIRPGEVTLAHNGVLFLDELPEFRRSALEALRPTMESGVAAVARARERVVMPARPLVIGAMNPCPCGYAGERKRICRCTRDQVQRYRMRVSGPIIDRFDIHIALPPVSIRTLKDGPQGDDTETVRLRVVEGRARNDARMEDLANEALHGPRRSELDRLSEQLEPDALRFVHRSMDRLGLSLRAYGKVLRVATTIADLEEADRVSMPHVAEAIQYRVLDRDPDVKHTRATAHA